MLAWLDAIQRIVAQAIIEDFKIIAFYIAKSETNL